MPRRARRAGVKYIKDDREREITFYKRRSGIFKVAADLSALTGANAAVVLETSNGKLHSFGTPAADPIVDAFLSGLPPAGPFAGEALNAMITRMQNDLARLEARKAEVSKRASLSAKLAGELLDEATPAMAAVARRALRKVEELDADEVSQHLLELTRVHQGISHRLPSPLHRRRHEEIGGRRSIPPPPPQWPAPPPRRGDTLPSSQGFSSTLSLLPPPIPPLQSSWSHLFPLRPPSSFANLQAPPPPLPAPLQAPYPYPYRHHSSGTEIIGNGAPPVPLLPRFLPPATLLPPLPPNQPPQIPPSPESLNHADLPNNYEEDPFAEGQWASDLVDEHYYSNLLGLDADLGSDDGSDMNQVDGDYDDDMYADTGLPADGGWVDMLMMESSSRGGDDNDDVGN